MISLELFESSTSGLYYNSLSEALRGFSESIALPSAFSPPDHPSAPNLSGRMGWE